MNQDKQVLRGAAAAAAAAAYAPAAYAPAEPTSPPIPAAVKHLDGATVELHQAINHLEERLSAVLAPQPPKSVGDSEKTTARHSLALQIDSGACSVGGAAARLQALINRLEL